MLLVFHLQAGGKNSPFLLEHAPSAAFAKCILSLYGRSVKSPVYFALTQDSQKVSFGLVCCLMFQSTAIVMSRQSVDLTTLFLLGKLRLSS